MGPAQRDIRELRKAVANGDQQAQQVLRYNRRTKSLETVDPGTEDKDDFLNLHVDDMKVSFRM